MYSTFSVLQNVTYQNIYLKYLNIHIADITPYDKKCHISEYLFQYLNIQVYDRKCSFKLLLTFCHWHMLCDFSCIFEWLAGWFHKNVWNTWHFMFTQTMQRVVFTKQICKKEIEIRSLNICMWWESFNRKWLTFRTRVCKS